jgi:hypothetical protein
MKHLGAGSASDEPRRSHVTEFLGLSRKRIQRTFKPAD